MIRVLIVASSLVSRSGLRGMLADSGFEVVAAVHDLESLDETLLDAAPDVVLVEVSGSLRQNGGEGMSFNALAHDFTTVLLVDQPGEQQFTQALRAGIRAILPRDVSTEQLQATLRAAVAGLLVAHPAEVGALLPALASSASGVTPLAEPLTKRELEVLQMLASGLANKEIAARLAISDHTAKFHVASILGKLGASTRTEAVAIGIRHGLVLL